AKSANEISPRRWAQRTTHRFRSAGANRGPDRNSTSGLAAAVLSAVLKQIERDVDLLDQAFDLVAFMRTRVALEPFQQVLLAREKVCHGAHCNLIKPLNRTMFPDLACTIGGPTGASTTQPGFKGSSQGYAEESHSSASATTAHRPIVCRTRVV